MSVSVNVTIPNLPANSGDLRYIVFDQEENELASGVTQANSDNLVVISWDGDGLDLLDAVAVHIDDFNGSNATSSKSCFGWTYAVNDDDDPVDEERWYWKANAENKGYISLNNELEMSGDFTLTMNTKLLSGGVSNSAIIGYNTSSQPQLTVKSDGGIYVRDSNGNLVDIDPVYDFTTGNAITISRSGETLTTSVDGQPVDVYEGFDGVFVFNLIGRYENNFNYTDGYIWNLEVSGVTNQPYTEISIPIDQPYSEAGIVYDSNGNDIGVFVNDTEDDYTEEDPSEIPVTVKELEFVKYTPVPDAQGVTEDFGFTNTGLFKMSSGNWLVGNHGQENSSQTKSPSVIILSSDFTSIVSEIDVSSESLAGDGSVQGVIEDNNGYIWFCAKDQDKVICIDSSGTYLDEISFTGPNGLAYNEVLNRIMIKSASSGSCSIVDLETKSEVSTYSVIPGGDQLCYVASQDYLYVTDGTNGVSGNVLIYDVSSGNAELINTLTAVNSEAIEGVGVIIDSDTRVYLCNDGGYHSEATIRDNAIMEYILIES